MRSVIITFLIGVVCLCSSTIAFSADDTLEMTCEHSVFTKMHELILYITLHNKGSKPIDVITYMPEPALATRGGAWMFFLSSDWYAVDRVSDKRPNRERLLPVTLSPNGSTTFTSRYLMNTFPDLAPPNQNTSVGCVYKVEPNDAALYNVWGGSLRAQSTYVPFYKE